MALVSQTLIGLYVVNALVNRLTDHLAWPFWIVPAGSGVCELVGSSLSNVPSYLCRCGGGGGSYNLENPGFLISSGKHETDI